MQKEPYPGGRRGVNIGTRFPPELHSLLKAAAARRGLSLARALREASYMLIDATPGVADASLARSAAATDDAFGHWLAGFIDGEGSFILRHHRHPSGREAFSMRFQLEVRADDYPIIAQIPERLGFGIVTMRPGMPRPDRTGTFEYRANPVCGWRVDGKEDIARLIDFLDRYPLRAKKARDYAIWREAALYWFTVQRRGNQYAPQRIDYGPLEEARRKLDEVRAYRDPELPPDSPLRERLGWEYESRLARA